MPDVAQLVSFGQTVIILFLLILFALRIWPSLERVRMREAEVREMEASARQKQAESLTSLSGVIKDVADAQLRTAENNEELRIFLRAAMREHENFNKRLNEVEGKIKPI
jgi:hypothetical protein